MVDSRVTQESVACATQEDFSGGLERLTLGWPSDLPVMACGMVGARDGWIEAPYVELPASAAMLAGAASAAPGSRSVAIVPGVALRASSGELIDVMRGEETLVMGAGLAEGEVGVCPGTHSKWILASSDGLSDFSTFMTGELFALLSRSSVLRRSVRGADARNDQAFCCGVQDGLEGKPLIQELFSVRVRDLDGADGTAAASRLSGLLVGAEVAAARLRLGERPLVLIAEGAIADLYAAALVQAGNPARRIVAASEAACVGLRLLWNLR